MQAMTHLSTIFNYDKTGSYRRVVPDQRLESDSILGREKANSRIIFYFAVKLLAVRNNSHMDRW